MHLDVVQLREFYYRTMLGRGAQKRLQQVLRGFWPDVRGEIVAGYGFAAPFLRPFQSEAERVLSLMPAQQGVMAWPKGARNLSVLTEETEWPLPNGSLDRLLVAHGLETCNRTEDLLKECWRVLAPGGSLIVMVPNRTGAWARRDLTPFGVGRPYSFGQLDTLLRDNRFMPVAHGGGLYAPPSTKRWMLKLAPLLELMGSRVGMPSMAGALCVMAQKQVYARPGKGARAQARGLDIFGGLRAGIPSPAPVEAKPVSRGFETDKPAI